MPDFKRFNFSLLHNGICHYLNSYFHFVRLSISIKQNSNKKFKFRKYCLGQVRLGQVRLCASRNFLYVTNVSSMFSVFNEFDSKWSLTPLCSPYYNETIRSYEMGGKRSGSKIKSTIKCKSPTLSQAFAFYYITASYIFLNEKVTPQNKNICSIGLKSARMPPESN